MILDTTILVDFIRGKETAVSFIRKNKGESLFTTEINVFELFTGYFAMNRDTNLQLDKINFLLSKLIILQLDRKASLKSGEINGQLIKKGQTIDPTDCLIAGIGLANNVTSIVTRNKTHFERVSGIKVISYT